MRVLNKDGQAIGDWAGALSPDELREGLRHMMTLRTFDARMLTAQRQGKTSFYMQHLGEEAISCAFARALEPGDMPRPYPALAGLGALGRRLGSGLARGDASCGDPAVGLGAPAQGHSWRA